MHGTGLLGTWSSEHLATKCMQEKRVAAAWIDAKLAELEPSPFSAFLCQGCTVPFRSGPIFIPFRKNPVRSGPIFIPFRSVPVRNRTCSKDTGVRHKFANHVKSARCVCEATASSARPLAHPISMLRTARLA